MFGIPKITGEESSDLWGFTYGARCRVTSAQHRMAEGRDANPDPKKALVQECGIAPIPSDANLDPKTASVQECVIVPVPPGAFTQTKGAWFGLRTMLMCQWW